ncbi:MAG: DUF861 domain-containing protein [Bacteroidetes bacterium]|nr:MAG: DUF861 domain-containing protein [Bacteroidota bacterium]
MKIIIQKLTEEEIQKLGIRKWPIWTKEKSTFDWFYDTREQCLFLEGKVRVKTEFEEVEFGKGDFVTFPQGLKCEWNVVEPVRKHYLFD